MATVIFIAYLIDIKCKFRYNKNRDNEIEGRE